jgi:16S rRNA (adenine1518-N6/adenine1519-N6)-dimethyltransferase
MRKAVFTDEAPEKFAHKKSLGQNFLTSDIVPGWICDAGEVMPGDLVFEIGPGTGMLTKTLLSRGATVTAVEADERAYTILKETFALELQSGQLTLHHGDAREITPQSLGLKPYSFKVVANIPYYLSGFLLRSFLENPVQPSTLVFLIQKELAHRIVRDKKESLLALSVKAFGTPRYFKTVTRGHFNPQPKVDSAILQITDINHHHFTEAGGRLFFELLHLGLGKKRKQLMTNLKEQYARDLLETAFQTLKLSPTVRGEDLPLPTWLQLLYTLNPQTKP